MHTPTTTRGYRLVGIDEAPYGTVQASLVVVDGWAHSTWSNTPLNGLQTAHVRRYLADGTLERHPDLDGAIYPAGSDIPRRLAYEAGVLAYHVRQVAS